MTKNYRKIWEEHNGRKIPDGYHIHHIDGNRSNNNPSNLLCVSPEEHWQIHFERGDPIAIRGKFVQGASEAGKKGGAAGKGKTITEEQKKKYSISLKESYKKRGGSPLRGTKASVKTKEKLSKSLGGENNPMFGKKHSQDAKNKISETRKNKIAAGEITPHKTLHSEETREKIKQKRAEYYENGGISPWANVYDILDENLNVIIENKTKKEIQNELSLSERTFTTIYVYSGRYDRPHPKHKIIILSKGKYHDIR